ncbi:MAG: peptidoglycan editing factor PgeF [Rhodospirillales bacterium]|jgi:YfiH family protein|nr:peptidoglycan editing factor PgeF [Rhodospirillales bacterium]
MITSSAFNGLKGVRHGFFTRRGGVSQGPYESLNCGYGTGDTAENVAVNRDRAMAMMDQPAEALVTVRQVHSAKAVVVDTPYLHENAPEADGLATAVPGIALGLLTADCMPVLFVDPKARVIGAAHAGWRGARSGIVEATVAAMESAGAKAGRIVALMGPCIRQGSYEVGLEFRETFLADSAANESFFAPSRHPGRFLFDLPTYIFRRLDALGLKHIQMLQIDTCREADRFFSHRRSTLAGEAACGRNLSAVVLGD